VVVVQVTPKPYGSPDDVVPDGTPEPLGDEPVDDEGPVRPRSVAERRRAEAVKTLEKKRGWQSGLVAYVVVNAFLVGVWALTGRGYFWPVWPIAGWGLGMVLSFWELYLRKPITEEDIEAELGRR
jgi:hypothetical protein